MANKNYSLFNEGTLNNVLGDIKKDINTATDSKNGAEKRINAAGNAASGIDNLLKSRSTNNSSIVARARNSVLQFPIYTVPTIRANEIHITAKLFERVYADLFRSVISQYPILNEDEANNLLFLKKFHTNIKESAERIVNKFYQPIDKIDEIFQESIFYKEQISENCEVEFTAVTEPNDLIVYESARLAHDPIEGFSYYFKEAKDEGNLVKRENNTTYKDRELKDNDDKEFIHRIAKDRTILLSNSERAACNSHDEMLKAVDNKIANMNTDQKVETLKSLIRNGQCSDSKFKYKDGKFYYFDADVTSAKTITGGTGAVSTPTLLKDSDIKKNNGMAPYNIECTFRIKNKNGVEANEVRFIIGIKSVLHVVRTQDLADELRELVTGNIRSLQKVRYKTGEISFINYLFNIKGLKSDAYKRTNTNKRWISSLKRLADYKNMNGSLFGNTNKMVAELTNGNMPIPNGTLILTQADILYLTSKTGIDLSEVSNAKKLAKNLFLIAIAIIDSTAGTMKVLFPDSDNSWDVQSLAAIDAEVAKTDNSKLMNELNKMVNR